MRIGNFCVCKAGKLTTSQRNESGGPNAPERTECRDNKTLRTCRPSLDQNRRRRSRVVSRKPTGFLECVSKVGAPSEIRGAFRLL
jgi:hypothetical protein